MIAKAQIARPSLADRIGLWIVFGLAAALTLLQGVFGPMTAIGNAVARRWDGELDLSSSDPLPAEAALGQARVSGSLSTASVTVTELSDSTAMWLLAGDLLSVIIGIIVTGSVAFLAWRLLEHKPFATSLTRSVLAAGTSLAFGSIVQQVVAGIAESELVYELDPHRDEILPGGSFWGIGIPGDLAPIGFGILLLLVAFAFQYGERLQRDTEGLV